MARVDQGTKSNILQFAGNGANRPLHQDRQVLRAGDLALEQATQDAMLARARRYLHGWGVVAGFMPTVKEHTLGIGPGYGVTPLGDELFLPENVSLKDAAAAVVKCCGPGPLGCDVIDPKALAEANKAIEGQPVTAFLIARQASREAALRPGVPEDCAHPASKLLPSRRCGGVEFAILCALPPSHQTKDVDCGDLMPLVCGAARQGTKPLPWERPFDPEANFLVIAELTVTGQALTAVVGSRRTLWPVALMQAWIGSCLCPLMATKRDPVPDDPLGRLKDRVEDIPKDDPFDKLKKKDAPKDDPKDNVRDAEHPSPDALAFHAETPPEDPLRALRGQLTGSVTEIPGVGAARAKLLAAIGVNTEGEFLATPSDELAKALGLPESKIAEMKQEVSGRHNLDLTF
jgi:hypothetical protein